MMDKPFKDRANLAVVRDLQSLHVFVDNLVINRVKGHLLIRTEEEDKVQRKKLDELLVNDLAQDFTERGDHCFFV